MTLLLLFYAFWAYDWFVPDGDEPQWDDLTCCGKVLKKLRDFQDMHLCFWGCIIVAEIVILVMFLVSLVFCILAGIKAFVAFGCNQIYVLGDDSVCTNILLGIRDWMSTFWTDMPSNINDACEVRTLTACKAISSDMMGS